MMDLILSMRLAVSSDAAHLQKVRMGSGIP